MFWCKQEFCTSTNVLGACVVTKIRGNMPRESQACKASWLSFDHPAAMCRFPLQELMGVLHKTMQQQAVWHCNRKLCLRS
mmetsp:Transcript_61537/g.102113  ORF Transcript_61537/g.102113 Transcript_61537/m.102113 type:complete len:80 (+) Transcript_61537:681-920(+)